MLNTPACELPESNHTSMMSISFVNVPFGLLGCVNPSGNKSFASRSNHTSEPNSSTNLATCSVVSGVMIGSPFSP